MSQMHRLLRRQLKNANLDPGQIEALGTFLKSVDKAYQDYEVDIRHLETIVEMSSKELFETNKKLKQSFNQVSTRLKRVIENIQEIIFETDLEGNWTYLNPAWTEFTGRSVEDSLGKNFNEFFSDISREELFKGAEFKTLRGRTFTKVFPFTHANGTEHWAEVSLKVISNEEGWYTGTIGSIVDITRLKGTEADLIAARDRASIASKAKDEFLSTMSHEIRTPLNAVIGLSHLLLIEDPKAHQLDYLNSLKYSSEHLLGLVNDILDFSKIESGTFELEYRPFSMDYVLGAVETNFKHKAAEKQINLIIERNPALPQTIIGDSMRLSQVFVNLVGNAVKFTEHGSVELRLEAASKGTERTEITFTVKDTGIGIPKEKSDLIFRSFTQANSDTTRKYGGTGLGLAISKKLIEKMGGTLTLESTEAVGTTFSFCLTFETPSHQTVVPATRATGDQIEFSSLAPLNVLVVEDNKMNIMVLQRFLKKWDVECTIAENGLEGVDLAKKHNFDLILMDLLMPVMNGYDSCEEIRANTTPHNRSVPILALSASAFMDVQDKVKRSGMDGHVSKPFNPKDLFEILKKYVPVER